MRQFIKISGSTWDANFCVMIDKVYEANGKLYVLSRMVREAGMSECEDAGGGDNEVEFSAVAAVPTSSEKELLPVVYVMMNVSQAELDRNRNTYVTTYSLRGENAVEFVVCHDRYHYAGLPENAALRYQADENDKIISFRLSSQHVARTIEPAVLPEKLPELKNILNIYSMFVEGVFKVVLESIVFIDTTTYDLVKVKKPRQLFLNISEDAEAFYRNYVPQLDREIYFDAPCKGELKKYAASACVLEVPGHDIDAVMSLLEWLNEVVRYSLDQESFRYRDLAGYDTIVFSTSSILACYVDALTTCQPVHNYLDGKHWQIVNDLPVTLETFVFQPQHTLQMELMRERLVGQIMALQQAPDYASLQAFFKLNSADNKDDIFNSPVGCMDRNYHINLFTLMDASIPIELREQHAARISRALMALPDRSAGKYFLRRFNLLAIGSLVTECCNMRSSKGSIYHSSSPEMQVLLHAEFFLLPDGRMCMNVANNPAYLQNYFPAYREDEDALRACEIDFTHWAAMLGLEFARDTDFHRCVIFTPESTRKLKARGLHLSAGFWDDVMVRVNRVTALTAAKSRFFNSAQAVMVATPEEAYSPRPE